MADLLYHRILGEPVPGIPPLVILHGLFGSSDNWFSIAKHMARERQVVLVDQRNHGRSFHSNDFSYAIMANDLQALAKANHWSQIDVLGHSMGGKTAMNLAIQHPMLLRYLIVVDIAPKAYPVHHGTIIEGLKALNLQELASRQEADSQLAGYVPEAGVRQFLLKNLARIPNEGFRWKINIPVLHREIENIGAGLPDGSLAQHPCLFIRGTKSNYILEGDAPLIASQFPQFSLKSIEAGHWVHAEKPQELVTMVEEFLNNA